MVTNNAIVGNVSIDHQKVVVSNLGDTASLDRAAMDRDTLADSVAITHFHDGWLPSVFQVLVVFSNRGERIDCVVSANAGVPAYDNVRLKDGAFANLDVTAYTAVGTNANASPNDGTFFNNCGGVDDSRFVDHKCSLSGMSALDFSSN
ncbi:hypothetical protein R69658_01482 [Paraburkholderia aspalathi]|uniref:Uncharacterized protein n=1 Tax=Paraburkholderia aspalathi TaxID=1324617 RepID=A0ABN7L3L7_9BURK|nr:hypothetical protein R69658_01482 [Paraburkholderia aspalathi]